MSEFPQFGLVGRITAEGQNLSDPGYTQTQNELQELNQDPYRIQLEHDLREEQEEYFGRIRQE